MLPQLEALSNLTACGPNIGRLMVNLRPSRIFDPRQIDSVVWTIRWNALPLRHFISSGDPKITAETQRSFHIDLSGMTNEKGDSGIRGEADPRVRRCRLSKSARGCPQCSQTAQWPLGTLLGEGRERYRPTCTRSLDCCDWEAMSFLAAARRHLPRRRACILARARPCRRAKCVYRMCVADHRRGSAHSPA